jgi:heme-degrading monooxygenase HmoA
MSLAAPTAQLASIPYALTTHYMVLPVQTSFNWDEMLAYVDEGQWYLVAFRSKHAANADEDELEKLDRAARESAMTMPGFLYYFMGVPLATGECLSFCLWNSKEEAAYASAQPEHREAVKKGLHMFEYYTLEQYHIHKVNGEISFERVKGHPHRGGHGHQHSH